MYKKELQENTAQLREHSDHMRLQRIESTIFNLIETHNNSIDIIKSNAPEYKDLRGIQLLEVMFREVLIKEYGIRTYQDMKKIKIFTEYLSLVNDSKALNSYTFILHYIHNLEGVSREQKQEFMTLLYSQIPIALFSCYVILLLDDKYHLEIIESYKMWWD